MSCHVSEDDLCQCNQSYTEHKCHRDENHQVITANALQPYTDSQQGEGSQQLVSSTEDRPDGEVGAKGHITGQYNGNQSSNKRVCENIALCFTGFRINLSEQLLENEAAQTGCGIQSSHSESGDGQSNEAFSYAEGEAELGHEGTNAVSKYVYRATVFQQLGQLVAANIANSNNCNYSQNAFKQHGAVADELSIAFAIELFGGSTGGYQGVETTDSTAGNGYEQHREHRVGAFAGRIKGGECRQLHGRLINCDTNQSECDAGIQQEGVQIVTRLQQNPDRSDRSNEDVNHQDANPYVFAQVQRIHVADSDCNNQHDNTDNGAYAEAQAAAIYGEAEDNSQHDEQQRSGCSLRACYEGSGYDVSESSDNNQQSYICENGEEELTALAQSCIDNLADSFAVKTDGGVQSTKVMYAAEEDAAD